jgi:hypothetical protein
MTSSFVAYIDESGDEGFNFLERGGCSHWFVLSALVKRKINDTDVVRTAAAIRQAIGHEINKPLHFKDIRKHDTRVVLSRMVGAMPCRTISVLIHKPSVLDPENFQRQPYALYRYASRLLLERISWLCRDQRAVNDLGDGTVDLIYSNRSAMSYEDLCRYLRRLEVESVQRNVEIDWGVVRPENVRAVNHDQLAGLQLADIVASSVWQAVSPNRFGDIEDRYLRLLGPTIYRNKGRMDGYGLKFWCSDRAAIAASLRAAAGA